MLNSVWANVDVIPEQQPGPGTGRDTQGRGSHLALPPLTACEAQASSWICLCPHFLFSQVNMTVAPCSS